MESRENGILQNIYDKIKTCRGTQHAGEDKKRSTGFIRAESQSFVEIIIYRSKVNAIVERKQHIGNHNISDKVAQRDLEIGKRIPRHCAWHADERDPAQRRADHAKSHEHPVGIAVADKERLIV